MYANVREANYSGWPLEQLACCKAHPATAERNCAAKYSATADVLEAYLDLPIWDTARFEIGPASSDPYEACADAATNAWYSMHWNSNSSLGSPAIRGKGWEQERNQSIHTQP